jgi:hypothetical protein
MAGPSEIAGVVAGLAFSADIRTNGIDVATGRGADRSRESGATIAVAPHAGLLTIDKLGWDQTEGIVGF